MNRFIAPAFATFCLAFLISTGHTLAADEAKHGNVDKEGLAV